MKPELTPDDGNPVTVVNKLLEEALPSEDRQIGSISDLYRHL